jgi:hypothetical protein
MGIIEICVAFVVAILGIAYPILLEVMSRLDDKYSSSIVVELFKKERESYLFKISLSVTLLLILFWIFRQHPLLAIINIDDNNDSYVIWLLLISTILLIIVFFSFIKKILIYYSINDFITYLIKKHNENN